MVAHLCNGVDLADLGAAVDPALLVPGLVPLPRHEADGLHAEVLWVDRFGNCQLNVGPAELAALTDDEVVAVEVGDERRAARVVRTFAELGAGSLGLVLDSHGMYALVARSALGGGRARRRPGRRGVHRAPRRIGGAESGGRRGRADAASPGSGRHRPPGSVTSCVRPPPSPSACCWC